MVVMNSSKYKRRTTRNNILTLAHPFFERRLPSSDTELTDASHGDNLHVLDDNNIWCE